MKINALPICHLTLTLGLCLAGIRAGMADEGVGAWSEGVVTRWDAETQDVVEIPVKVWDARSGTSHRFTWTGQVDEAGLATGKGLLEWRESDAPDFGPEGLQSVYQGGMEKGRRSGQGKIRFANGERYSGGWLEDLPGGWGEFWFANGDYYQGEFAGGRMEGKGTYVSAGREIYEGGFVGGKRHGVGVVKWGGGESYESEWVSGVETEDSMRRRQEILDRLAPGDGIQIGLVSALLKNERFHREGTKPLTYVSYFEDGEFGFRPEGDFLESYQSGGLVDSYAPEIGSLFMEMAFENRDSRPLVIERGEVEVIESIPDLAPYLFPWLGASGIQFELANAGWGAAQNCVFEFDLHRSGEGPEPGSDEEYEFRIELGDFEERTLSVDMADAFRACGVDVEFVREHQNDSMNYRGKWRKDQADPVFGRFAQYDAEGTIDSASVDLMGRLSYEWVDHEGEKQSHSVLYTGFIQLIYLVEGGDAMGAHARYDIGLLSEGQSYRLPFRFAEKVEPFREARFGLDLNSERSSFHRFRVVLHCSDGRTLRSPVCRVQLFNPRDIESELGAADGLDGEMIVPGDSPYLFPDSHQRLLTDDELGALSPDQLWQARNEIFVRRGYVFGSDRGKQLAASFGDLYQAVGGIDVIDPLLNEFERANIEAIKRYESR